MTATHADAPLPLDEAALRHRVEAERLRQFMQRGRLTAASGALPSAYTALLMAGEVPHTWLLGWWLALLLFDSGSLLHTSWFLRHPDALPAGTWLRRQVLLQSLAGLVWGAVVPLAGQAATPQTEADVGMVLMTVNSVALIGLLHYRRAVVGWTLGVWALPILYYLVAPSLRHLQLGLGIGVLVVSLNFYLWRASAQVVDGLERRFRADALAEALQGALERIRVLATRDELTGLANRRHGMDSLRSAWPTGAARRADGQPRPLSLLLIDIDHFKRVNDELGHPAGDEVLRQVSQRLQSTLRGSDLLARIGGEEFMAVLPDTSLDEAALLAERLRAAVSASAIGLAASQRVVTVSIGVAQRQADDSAESLLAQADAALYQAKRGGRDRVQVAFSASVD